MRAFWSLVIALGVAIAISVGAIAAIGTPVYGLPGHRFTADFLSTPRIVHARIRGEVGVSYCAQRGSLKESVVVTGRQRGHLELSRYLAFISHLGRGGCPIGWVAYAPLTGATSPSAHSCDLALPGATLTRLDGGAGSLFVDLHCQVAVGSLLVNRATGSYYVLATSLGDPDLVDEFLYSFRPLNG